MTELKLTAGTETEQRILDYLQENASEPLAEKINAGEKTLAGCIGYIRHEARKKARNGVAVIEDAEVYGWAVHYFEEDEIKEGAPAGRKQNPEQLRKMAIDAEQREKEIARRNAEKREAREAAERKLAAEAEAAKAEMERKKAEREAKKAQEAAERARAKAEKENKAAAGQFSLFDLFGTEG